MDPEHLAGLRLLQLADSALPIGAAAHSFGLETLTSEGLLDTEHMESFLRDYLVEMAPLEGAFCRSAHRLGAGPEFSVDGWVDLNRRVSARKPARESRVAAATLGRRFLGLLLDLGEWPRLRLARERAAAVYPSTAFGLAGAVLGLEEEATVLAFLHQATAGSISACQRLLPLGQTRAARLLWDLKPLILELAAQSRAANPGEVPSFPALLELGAMRHPDLSTRLFIS
ncbi:MAG: hypothetical protein HYR60_00485 [Acidobacteria bacterium]|nr:hypothetical protein [Acidobacteriota bacterium]